jgi:hypothetical protein
VGKTMLACELSEVLICHRRRGRERSRNCKGSRPSI